MTKYEQTPCAVCGAAVWNVKGTKWPRQTCRYGNCVIVLRKRRLLARLIARPETPPVHH